MMSGRPWHGLTKSMPHVQLQRLLYLSTRVVQAFKLVEGDPNKRLTLQVSVSRAENEAVKRLADFHGLGKERLIKKLLAAEYNLRFPS